MDSVLIAVLFKLITQYSSTVTGMKKKSDKINFIRGADIHNNFLQNRWFSHE